MTRQFTKRPEYPELVVCMGVPSLDGETVYMRVPIEDGEPQSVDFTVALCNFAWVNMPVFDRSIPDVVRTLFNNYGMALVACRIIERQPGYVIVEVPALSGNSRLSVKPGNIARRYVNQS